MFTVPCITFLVIRLQNMVKNSCILINLFLKIIEFLISKDIKNMNNNMIMHDCMY